jgi:tellurium resistance protein TerD
MSVVVYEDGKGVRLPAAQVPQLRSLFGPAAAFDAPAPAASPDAAPPLEGREAPGHDKAETIKVRSPSRASAPLPRGGNISLSRAAPGLRTVIVGLGWNEAIARSRGLDLDIIVFIQNAHGKVRYDSDVVFFNNPTGAHGAVRLGTEPWPEPAGNVQSVTVELDALGSEVCRLSFALAIYEGEKRKQDFGMVKDAYIQVVNADDEAELACCNMSPGARTETAVVFGEIYNRIGEWKFRAVDQGFAGGLAALAKSFGVEIENA